MRIRAALALVFAAVVGLASAGAGAAEVTLRFLDVGQGDAALVSSQGHHALIDSGPRNDMAERLRALGVGRLDLLVSTHNHMDHFGGAESVLRELPVAGYLDNGLPAKSKAQETILRLADLRRVPYVHPDAGTVTVGEAVLRILPPAIDDANQNDASVGVIVERGRFRAMLPGDAEQPALSAWLAGGLVSRVDVLKAAHHGSRNGLTPLWLDRTRPRVVVISVGAGNDYGHPHAWALRYYEAGGRTVLRTDRDGEVRISIADDGSYVVSTERGPRLARFAATGAASGAAISPATTAGHSVARVHGEDDATVDAGRGPGAGQEGGLEPTSCCRVCKAGKACGNGCVSREAACTKPPGCACNAR